MPGEILLDVVTPARRVLAETTEFVALPGAEGEFGVLHNHAPLIAGLSVGILRFGPIHGAKKRMFVAGGFAEVADNRITVLADAAELAEEIDIARAKAAKDRAERRLHEHSAAIDFQRAQLALQKAITRLKIADARD